MDMNDFYEFNSKYLSSAFQVDALNSTFDKNGSSYELNLVRGIYEDIDFPVLFKHYQGKKLLDIINTGRSTFFLISDRLKLILEQNNLTGWKAYHIKIYDKKQNEILGYHGFSVIGRCDSVYYKDNTIFEKQFAPGGPLCQYYKGEFFDIDKWDKTDFFMPIDTNEIFVTTKVCDIIKKNKITIIEIKKLINVEIDVSIVRR